MSSNLLLCIAGLFWILTGCQKPEYNDSNEKLIGDILLKASIVDIDPHQGIDFTYRISTTNGTYVLEYGLNEQQKYLDRIYYFSYQVENDFWLEYNGIQQKCVGVFFERDYKLTNDILLHVHFDYPGKVPEDGQILLSYHAKEFNFPPVKMRFQLKT